ncbi:MAG: OmpH family outer membrane protein [Candidatus Aminicenantes bacterium]|nr:OmpH family outer membrane protein [Candidatus Aminicenantes bacterium]
MIRSTRKGIVLTLFVAVLVSAGFAQQTLQIAVVDSQQVLEKSAEGKKVMAQLQSKDSKAQADVAKMDEDIRVLETRLNTQRLTLTQESMIQMQADLERKRTERTRFTEDLVREMQELQARLFNRIQSELLPIIEAVGKEKNLDLIFDLGRSGAIYFNPATDLTAEIILKYDASKASK